MSLVAFHARNHPQQAHNPNVDDRAITPEDFAPLHARFHFTIDAAASTENARLPRFWTVDDDALGHRWTSERIWCNPPYSAIEPWPAKANASIVDPLGADLIVMLLPANRTEQGWWQRQIEPHRDRGGLMRVEFIPGRLRFLKPGQTVTLPNERPPFGCCLAIWTRPGRTQGRLALAEATT